MEFFACRKNSKTNISAGVKQFFRENENRGKLKYMKLADKKKAKGCVFYNKQRNTYGAVIPMSWNNGKRKQLYFNRRYGGILERCGNYEKDERTCYE